MHFNVSHLLFSVCSLQLEHLGRRQDLISHTFNVIEAPNEQN